jgi:hypothetical protein
MGAELNVMNRLSIIAGLSMLAASIVGAYPAPAPQAQAPAKERSLGPAIGKIHNVTIVGSDSVNTPNTATYSHAHLVTDNGSTLDTLKLEAFLTQTGTVQKIVATGSVIGSLTQAITSRKYTVYSDEAVFDPKLNQIHLTGAVKIVIESAFTKGPLIQTGSSAIVQLGDGPDFPVITTNDVKTNFALNQ